MKIGECYRGLIEAAGTPVGILAVSQDRNCVWAQFTVFATARTRLQERLKSFGVPTAVHYPRPLHLQAAYAHLAPAGDCPHSTEAAERVLSLPMSADLGSADLTHIVDVLGAQAH